MSSWGEGGKSMLRFWWIFTLWDPRNPKNWFWNNVVCTLYSATVAGDESTSGIKMKLDGYRTRLGQRCGFSGSCVISGLMEGSLLGDVLAYLQIFRNPL